MAFRDDMLLHVLAPEIIRGVGELRALALARCAWAYRVLAVQVATKTKEIHGKYAQSLFTVKTDLGILPYIYPTWLFGLDSERRCDSKHINEKSIP